LHGLADAHAGIDEHWYRSQAQECEHQRDKFASGAHKDSYPLLGLQAHRLQRPGVASYESFQLGIGRALVLCVDDGRTLGLVVRVLPQRTRHIDTLRQLGERRSCELRANG
jgi:hypothetical protein